MIYAKVMTFLDGASDVGVLVDEKGDISFFKAPSEKVSMAGPAIVISHDCCSILGFHFRKVLH